MVRRRQTDLGILFQEALRERIGEKRHQYWFATGVRFAFEGSELSVEVDTPFMVDWIVNSGYVHIFEQIGRELFATEINVKISLKGSEGAYVPTSPRPAASPADLFSLDPSAQLVSSSVENAARQSAPAAPVDPAPSAPPKRKRGRPRKNPVPEPAPASAPVQTAPVQDSLFDLPSTEFDVLSNDRRVLDWSSSAPYAAPVQAPPKRKRGRPRKNPVPERESTSVRPEPVDALPAPASPNLAPRSFIDVYQTEQRRQDLNAQNALANPRYANPAGVDLSESERAAWAVGDFDASDAETLVQPRVDALSGGPAPRPFSYSQQEPRRRGRPKGSTNRKPANVEQRALFPSVEDDEEEEVSRDSRGFNVVARPREPARVRAEVGVVRFASLNTFIEGFSNRFARRVLDVAITQPGAMNPVFVHGPTSVGKTHLLEGICDAYSRMPGARPPLYMTSEQFTSAFIHSLRGGGTFRDRFRNISLFALDDVHFLEGKTSTQTELLNVLDFLRSAGVQIVFSANKPLNELTKLRGELTTRIESGVVCPIKNPERETLALILRQMAIERNMIVGDDVCRYVVSRFATHARQLSGALNRLLATQLTTGMPINLELAREALADLAASNLRSVRLDDVERVVQEVFGLESNALKSSSRAKKCADPRAVAMWIARKHTRAALAEIGNFFGGRKHSAVLSAQKKVDAWIETNETLDAAGAPISVNEAIERVERALSYPRQ